MLQISQELAEKSPNILEFIQKVNALMTLYEIDVVPSLDIQDSGIIPYLKIEETGKKEPAQPVAQVQPSTDTSQPSTTV